MTLYPCDYCDREFPAEKFSEREYKDFQGNWRIDYMCDECTKEREGDCREPDYLE